MLPNTPSLQPVPSRPWIPSWWLAALLAAGLLFGAGWVCGLYAGALRSGSDCTKLGQNPAPSRSNDWMKDRGRSEPPKEEPPPPPPKQKPKAPPPPPPPSKKSAGAALMSRGSDIGGDPPGRLLAWVKRVCEALTEGTAHADERIGATGVLDPPPPPPPPAPDLRPDPWKLRERPARPYLGGDALAALASVVVLGLLLVSLGKRRLPGTAAARGLGVLLLMSGALGTARADRCPPLPQNPGRTDYWRRGCCLGGMDSCSALVLQALILPIPRQSPDEPAYPCPPLPQCSGSACALVEAAARCCRSDGAACERLASGIAAIDPDTPLVNKLADCERLSQARLDQVLACRNQQEPQRPRWLWALGCLIVGFSLGQWRRKERAS